MSTPTLVLRTLNHPLATTKGDRLAPTEADQNFIELLEAITNPTVRVVSTNDAMVVGDCIILVDTNTNPVTLTLPPSAATNRNLQYQVGDYTGNASNNPISLVDPEGGLINGQVTFDIDLNFGFALLLKPAAQSNWYVVGVTTTNVCCGGDPCAAGPFEFAALANVASLQFIEGVAQDYVIQLLVSRTCCPGPITIGTVINGAFSAEVTTTHVADFSGNTASITVSATALVAGPATGDITITLTGCSPAFVQTLVIPIDVLDALVPNFVVEPILPLTVEVNNSVVGNVDIQRIAGCADPIDVVAIGTIPTGITIAPFTIPALDSTAPFTVVAGPTAVPGNYTVTLEFSGCLQVKTQTFTLEVLPESLLPDFTINPIADLQVVEGENITATLVVSRINGCTDVLTVTTVGILPAGVIINPFTLPGNSTNFLIQTDISAIPGIYPITLRVVGCGQDKTLVFNLEVLAEGVANLVVTPTPLDLTFILGQLNTQRVVFDITRTNCPFPIEVSVVSSKGALSTLIVNGITQVTGNQLEVEIVNPDYTPVGSETLTFSFTACGVTTAVGIPVTIEDPCLGVTPELELTTNYPTITFTSTEDEVLALAIRIGRTCCNGPVTLAIDPSLIAQYKGQTAELTNGLIISSRELFGMGSGVISGDELVIALYNSNLHPTTPGNYDLIITATSDCTSPQTVAQLTIPIQIL